MTHQRNTEALDRLHPRPDLSGPTGQSNWRGLLRSPCTRRLWQAAKAHFQAVVLACCGCLAIGPTVAAVQDDERASSLQLMEGTLNNDAFLPFQVEAESALLEGDKAWARYTAGESGALTACFEAWYSALDLDEAAGGVRNPLPDPEAPVANSAAEQRLVQGVSQAIRLRLQQLPAAERRQWSERFEALALSEWEQSGHSAEFQSQLMRRFPLTTIAVRAALHLTERELERGNHWAASEWCERGFWHAQLLQQDASLARALEVRAATLRSHEENAYGQDPAADPARNPAADVQDPWRQATHIEGIGGVSFLRKLPGRSLNLDPNWTPGLAFLDDGRIAVQSKDKLSILRSAGMVQDLQFAPLELLPQSLRPRTRWSPSYEVPWPYQPACDGERLTIVSGRRSAFGDDSNALICLSPPDFERGLGISSPVLPQLHWALVGEKWIHADGRVESPPELAPLAACEIQPGPLLIGSRVLVQARVLGEQAEAWLICLDARTGQLQWMRLLGQGAGLVPSRAVLRHDPLAGPPGQPLNLIPLRPHSRLDSTRTPGSAAGFDAIFVGSNLGFGTLAACLDGEIFWSFKNRRRAAADRGWLPGGGPQAARLDSGQTELRWAPGDGDFLYRLNPLPTEITETPLLAAPQFIGEARRLVSDSGSRMLVQGQFGAREVLTSWGSDGNERVHSLFLARGENFTGSAAASESRVFCASDRGLYLFDRSEDLKLLDFAPYPALERPSQSPAAPAGPLPTGGSVFARNARVFVLGQAGLWSFSAE